MQLLDKRQSSVATYHTAPLLARALTKWQTQREQRSVIKKDQKRIRAIDGELQAVDKEKGDLLQRIVSNQLEIIEILALRNTYEKEAANSRIKGEPDPFTTLTEQFIDEHITTIQTRVPDASSQAISDKKQSLRRILSDVFALDNTNRNQLVIGFSHYSRLYNEKQSLLAKY